MVNKQLITGQDCEMAHVLKTRGCFIYFRGKGESNVITKRKLKKKMLEVHNL